MHNFRSLTLLARGVAAALACAGAVALAQDKAVPATAPDATREAKADAYKVRPVLAPHYGDTLFRFYQDQYFSAITSLMVSQHFDRVSQHADEAEVLRGGMLLSYGMHHEAGRIFAQLIDKGAPPAVRDRAWYFLAKIRYQRGFIAEAEEAIARIEAPLPGAMQEDRALLQAQLLMAKADYAGAAAVLETLAKSSDVGTYARYNLGIAWLRAGDAERGIKLLDEIGKTPVASEDLKALRDKANVALGFAALQGEKPEAARAYLERVRLSSMLANKALLGFGWASASLTEYKKALVPWQELTAGQRDSGDAAVLEARMAVAHAYGELGAFGQSLDSYKDAIGAYEREHVALDESIAAIRSGKLVQGLLERNPGDEMGWFWTIRELPELPHASHLTQVLAQHEFQEAFKNWRDLRFLAGNLQGWVDTLGVYNDMLANRRQAYAERLPGVMARASDGRLAELAVRGALLGGELASAENAADGLAFMNDKEREQMDRIKSIQATLSRMGDDAQSAQARERARLVAGAHVWNLAQSIPDRLWRARKALTLADAGISEARQREAALARAKHDEPARHEQFAQRIAALGRQVQALIPKVAALTNEQQGYVQELAVAELTRQQERLAAYTTQAQFAVAQLYDRAALARSSDASK
ncbi:MAG: hypothetical protein U1E89_06340 [Burkholderiaceae bacterium]